MTAMLGDQQHALLRVAAGQLVCMSAAGHAASVQSMQASAVCCQCTACTCAAQTHCMLTPAGGCATASNGYTLGPDPASTLAYGGSAAPGGPSLHSPGMRPASAAYASAMGSPGGRMLMQPQAMTPTGVHYSPGAAGQHFLQVLGSPCDSGPAQVSQGHPDAGVILSVLGSPSDNRPAQVS